MARLTLFFLAAALSAQDAARIRETQAAAAAKQRESARAQAGATGAASDSFFTIPFDTPVTSPQLSGCSPAERKAVDELVRKAAQKESVGLEVLQAVIEVESGYDSCAVSNKGAQGLMQLMPQVQQELGVDDPFDAGKNVEAGARLLKKLLADFKGDLKLALSAYNAGSARVTEAKGVPRIAETQDYVEKILKKIESAKAAAKPP